MSKPSLPESEAAAGKKPARKGKRKQIGYLALEWICPQCSSRNPGDKTICVTCGLPQPKDVGFVPPLQPTILTTGTAAEAAAALIEAGADIHCPWCGVRNRATARQCTQCQGSLAGGDARQSGEDLGALNLDAAPDVTCASCHTINAGTALYCIMCGAPLGNAAEPAPEEEAPPAVVEEGAQEVAEEPSAPAESASVVTMHETDQLQDVLATATAVLPGAARMLSKRAQLWITIALLVAIGGLLLYGWWQRQPKTLVALPVSAQWQRTIEIEAETPIALSGWRDEMPAGVAPIACTSQPRSLSEEPEGADAVEVCGTPYAVDTGTGVAEVYQDCLYQVNDDYCTWQGTEWQPSTALVRTGSDLSPQWPALDASQRELARSEAYTCTLRADAREFVITLTDDTFTACATDRVWQVRIDGDGDLIEATPE